MEKEIKKRLSSTFEKITPDDFSKVLEKTREKKGDNKMNKKNIIRIFTGIAAAIAIFIIATFAIINRKDEVVASRVILDINPSVEIKLNKDDMIIDIDSLNKDAENLGDFDNYKNKKLEFVLDEILNTMIKGGYITKENNTVLYSIENINKEQVDRLKLKLENISKNTLESKGVKSKIITQKLNTNDEIALKAKNNKISEGKLILINKAIKKDSSKNIENLKDISISKINDIIKSNNEYKLISENEALEIVYRHANIKLEDIIKSKIELDNDESTKIYEIEIKTSSKEFDYDINAINGEIIKKEVKNNKNTITKKEYINIALKHNKILINNAKNIKSDIDEDGAEIDFISENKEYEVEIDRSGKVVKNEVKVIVDTKSNSSVSKDKLIDIALKENSLKRENITDLEVDFDDDGIEVEYKSGNKKYKVELDYKGNVLKNKIEDNDDIQNTSEAPKKDPSSNNISREEAINIALSYNNLSRNNITDLEVESDNEGFEIEFKSGNNEYEVKVNYSGNILKNEVDND